MFLSCRVERSRNHTQLFTVVKWIAFVEMSSLLLRSVLQQCCRRAYQPVMPLFQIPKRQYFIVPEPDEIDEEEHEFFQDWIEIQKEDIDASEQEAGDFGSDPYPYYRKVGHYRLSARLSIFTPKLLIALFSSRAQQIHAINRSIRNAQKQDFKMPGKGKDACPFAKLEG